MKPLLKQARFLLEYLAVRILISLVQVLPIEVCDRLAQKLAFVFTHWIPLRARVIDENLAGAFPEQSAQWRLQKRKEMWHYLIIMAFEIAQAPRKIHETNWRKFVVLPKKTAITGPLVENRPTLLVSGHFGNFELGGFITGLLGFSTHTMVRKLDNPYLDRLVTQFRSRNGQYMLPKEGSAPMVQELMDNGGTITVLGDQHAGTKGCWIDFLGRPASCHKAVALFTLSGQAPMVMCICRRIGPLKFEITSPGTADPAQLPAELGDVKSLTQWYNDHIARAVRRNPEQYWWIHRRWKEKPVRKTRKRVAAAKCESPSIESQGSRSAAA